MIQVDYPQHPFKMKTENGKEKIFDAIRKKWVVLTPEEWVRQNIIQYLLSTLKYPGALIAVEKKLMVGTLPQRCDILVYKSGKPWMIIECKQMNVELNGVVLDQALRYNLAMPADYIIITNGSITHGWKRVNNELKVIDTFPSF